MFVIRVCALVRYVDFYFSTFYMKIVSETYITFFYAVQLTDSWVNDISKKTKQHKSERFVRSKALSQRGTSPQTAFVWNKQCNLRNELTFGYNKSEYIRHDI